MKQTAVLVHLLALASAGRLQAETVGSAAPPPAESVAESPAPAPPNANPSAEASVRDRASAHFQKGIAFYSEGESRLALAEFERAYALVPEYRVLYNLGTLAAQVGQYARARRALERYLEEGGEAIAAERRAAVEQDLTVLRERTATLAITVDREGAEILLDDAPIGQSPLVSPYVMDVGDHRVTVRHPDCEPMTLTVSAGGGEATELQFALVKRVVVPVPVPITAPSPRADSPPPKAPEPKPAAAPAGPSTKVWVAWGGTAAIGASALGAFAIGANRAEELKRLKGTVGVEAATLQQTSAAAQGWLLATDILLGVAAVGAGVSLYFTFEQPKQQVSAAPVALRISGAQADLALKF